ncbi:MAG TPA: phage/plasmid primase, P4 family [Thermoplasmata archaeon]|nr:phage/plasmid primase, P4 family [Thermoplasmata archaeon]
MISVEYPDDLFPPDKNGEAKPSRVKFVEWLTQAHTFAAPSDTFGVSGYELFVYDGVGLYRAGARALIHRRVEAAFENGGRSADARFPEEVSKAIARRSLVPRDVFNPPGLVNFENGVLDPASGQLRPHSSALRFTRRIPIAFDPTATCPRFDRFLLEVQPLPSVRREIQKLFGYVLAVPGNPYQLAFMLAGPGNNGKSTLLTVLAHLVGPEAVSAETLQSLTDNYRFSTARLFGKLLNVFADLPANPIRYTSIFKALTGGDRVRAELKHGAIFDFVNQAKLVFSANDLPTVDDRTYAFWRRWRLWRFSEDFTGREDRQLDAALRAEMAGILNWALGGAKLLEADGGFIQDAGAAGLETDWRRRSDNLAWFVEESIEVDPMALTAKDDLYEEYADFCGRNRTPPKAPEIVGKELPRHVPSVRSERPGVDGVRVRSWRGVRLRAQATVQPPGQQGQPGRGAGQTTLLDGSRPGSPGRPGGGTVGVGRTRSEDSTSGPAIVGDSTVGRTATGSSSPAEPAPPQKDVALEPLMEEESNWTVPPRDRARRRER